MRRPRMRIGQEFVHPSGETFRVTDAGSRTFLALNVTETLGKHGGDESWLKGPPYAVVELVFDETDYLVLAECEGIEWVDT